MLLPEHFPISQVHVNSTGETGIETSHRAHNINALEVFRPVFFEQWRVLNGVLVRSRCTVYISRAGIPGSWRIRMIVRYFPIAYDNVMRKHSPHGFVEPAANAFVRYLEVRPCL